MKFTDWLFVSLPRFIIGALLLAMVAINLANVIGRHALGVAIFWSEEIMTLALVWGVFIGIIAVTYKGDHLKMDLVSQTLPETWKRLINFLTIIVLVLSLAYTLYYSYQVVSLIHLTGQVSNAAKYPLVIQHFALLLGIFSAIVAILLRCKSYYSGKFGK